MYRPPHRYPLPRALALAVDRDGGASRWFDKIGAYSRVDHDAALSEALV